MVLSTYIIVILAIYLVVLLVLLYNKKNKENLKVKIIFKSNNKQIMESKIKLSQKQKVSVVSVNSDGTEVQIKFSELSLVSSTNTAICTVEPDGDDFCIVPVSQGTTQIVVQLKIGNDTLTESLDVIIGEELKVVSIKFVLGELVSL